MSKFQKKKDQTDFQYLCDLKLYMKSFFAKEDKLRKLMDNAVSNKEFKKYQEKLDDHLSTFNELEENLVREEAKMINLERGLYKGIGINVRDKTYEKIPMYLKFKNLDNHAGCTGTTRVGKTKNMISDAQQFIEKGYDVIVVDPKGGEGQEILTEIMNAAFTSKRTEDFKYLSPAFPNESEYVNLLYGMADDEIASMIKTFAESMNEAGFFPDVVYENTLCVLKSLSFIQAATDPSGEYTKKLEQRELQRYLKLKMFKNPNVKPTTSRWNSTNNPNELHIISEKDKEKLDTESLTSNSHSLYQNRSMVTLKVLSSYTTYSSIEALQKIVANAITIPPLEKIGMEKYTDILRLKEEALSLLDNVLGDEVNFGKISKSHSVLLTQLVYGDVGEVFSGVGINPIANRLLSDEKGLICVMQPYPMKYKTVSNVSVMALLKSIESIMGLVGSSGRANKRRLVIFIDEAGAVLYKGAEDLFNKAGGLGVTMMVYTQSFEDYNLSVGQISADIIDDNTNTKIAMLTNNPKSAARIAESLGSVRKHEAMYMSMGVGASGRFSTGNQDEEVALAEDITELPKAAGYMRHMGETYFVDFPYVKGLENYPISMPTLENERSRRELSKYEAKMIADIQMVNTVNA